jgi:transposase
MAKEPEQIELSQEEIVSLHERIKNFTVTKEDMAIFGKALDFFVWMQIKLQKCQLTINKLKKIIFGSTEKSSRSRTAKNCKAPDPDVPNIPASETPCVASEEIPFNDTKNEMVHTENLPPSKAKGHGRMGADEYHPDETIHVQHASLKPGDACPTECGGKLYRINEKPGGIIRIKGQSCAHVVCYKFEKLRCALCGASFTADPPKAFPLKKYDAYFVADLVIQKYFMASPFYRQEQHQRLLGFRLPDSTQWSLVESAADCAYPVLKVLEKMAANGTHMNHDDTKVKILDIIRKNKLEPEKTRKGTFTTCIFAQSSDYKICLYYSSAKHSGENVSRILELRDKSLPPIIRMCDALSSNVPSGLETVLCHCLTHGRRKFTDIENFFPEECNYVIEQLAFIYQYDDEAKEKNMTADERLAHHQTYSAPVMDVLKTWMQEQFDERKVEPNSALGGAIRYMQKHWEELTRFLSVSGAHIDNNLVERALKLAIRTRKNAMFHKSLHGAFIASLFLSLIATCELAGKNPRHYLIALQENKSAVFKSPHLWLPWNYEATLNDTEKIAEPKAA